jgi:hypothetical protein
MLNLNDKSVSDIISSDMSGVFYVATSGEKLYCTDNSTGTVTCCDLHGTTQWELHSMKCSLMFYYSLLVTSNRKAVLLLFTTNNLLVDLS